ncbi:response regulator transcription factor [Methylomonas sp. LL1]|uniref:response regulator n=1 Tax=Methylomonas sp. LL1 TaxID=2785785 RepID=UPI0018C3EB19|nr:response regulator transcription factor [Methylomonas sp. LL1]QPK64901.1 response regulator transcription factor [Methylomonas sp. LL1]CAG1020254.1 Response regulator UvrY [Methylococcales bacterium]
MHKVKRILVADDHLLLREGLRQLFEYVDDIQIGAEAATGDEVLKALALDSFDLLLLDISLPGIHGEELIGKIRRNYSNLPILILSMHNEPAIAKRMIQAGASGFITKGTSSTELLEAMRKVAAGRRFISAEMAEEIFFLDALSPVGVAPHEILTAREDLVLRLLAQGHTVNQIARRLHLSNKTVSAHKSNLMEKMQINNFAELMQYAITHGLNE